MKILRIIATVDPATGGPVAGLRAVTPALSRLGHQTEFLTVDEDTAGFLQSFVGPVHALGPSASSYAYARRVRPWLERNIHNYDAVIVHGLWQYFGPIVRKLTRDRGSPPYFIFPHGMLDPTLRRTYPAKHVKKWLYWLVAERRVLRDARAVFFTCDEERRLARTTFPAYRCNERVVAYGTAAPDGDVQGWDEAWRQRCPKVSGRPYFIFLGRIHSKKGVDLLLKAYQRLNDHADANGAAAVPDLVIAGPCFDPAYLTSLKQLVRGRVAEKVHWTGMLTGDAKWGALHRADAFILPSHQENFGIAVVEALACGTPVLLSDRVNIWREIADARAAIVEPPTEDGTLRLFQRWLQLDEVSRARMRESAQDAFTRRFEVSHVAQSLAEELSSLIARPN
jgi:glycosyltransferase involved in cell wall biosynthesis